MTPQTLGYWLITFIKVAGVFGFVLIGVTYATLLERRGSAFIQDRLGPNRVGWAGLLQPWADAVKNLLKEETYPTQADRWMFIIAPAVAFTPALLTFAVIPFGAPAPGFDLTPHGIPLAYDGQIPMVVADLPVGFLYIVALSSLAVYGVVLAGWSSNSKYSLLGGLRATAQMLSYEISLGLSIVVVLLLAGNVTLGEIVARQQQSTWFVLPLFLTFLLFQISVFAEANRLPFDLPEAESELIAGYHAEYSAMKFSMFFIAEYAHMITASGLLVSLFFGGWDIPFVTFDDHGGAWWITLLTMVSFFLKTAFFVFLYVWVRWTLPRFRYDQLMTLGWRIMLPFALTYVMVMAGLIYLLDEVLNVPFGMGYGLMLFGVNAVAAVLAFYGVDRGRLIPGGPAAERIE